MSIFENKSMYETFKYALGLYESAQVEYGYECLMYLKDQFGTDELTHYACDAQFCRVTESIGVMIDDMERLEYPVKSVGRDLLRSLKNMCEREQDEEEDEEEDEDEQEDDDEGYETFYEDDLKTVTPQAKQAPTQEMDEAEAEFFALVKADMEAEKALVNPKWDPELDFEWTWGDEEEEEEEEDDEGIFWLVD